MFIQMSEAVMTDRVIVVEGGWRARTEWCGMCGAAVEMIPSEEFAAQSCVSLEAVRRLLEGGAFHGPAGAAVSPLICPNSPLRIVARAELLNPAARAVA